MENEYTKMLEIEELLSTLYGKKNTHLEYLDLYKELLSISTNEDKLKFYDLLNNYAENYNFQEDKDIKEIIEIAYKYLPWFKISITELSSYIIENKSISLAFEVIEFACESKQIKLIDLIFSEQKVPHLRGYNLSDNILIYISRKLINNNSFTEAIEFSQYYDINFQELIDYVTLEIKNKNAGDVKHLGAIAILYLYDEESNYEEYEKAILENYSGKEIFDFLIDTSNMRSLIFPFLKILVRKENREYLKHLLNDKRLFFEFKEMEINYVCETNDLELMLLVLEFNGIYHYRKSGLRNKLLTTVILSNGKEAIDKVINIDNYGGFQREIRELYIDYVINNSLSFEIICLFLNESDKSCKLKLFKSIISLGCSEDLIKKISLMNEEKIYSIYELVQTLSEDLKITAGSVSSKESLTIYRSSLEILSSIKDMMVTNVFGEDINLVALNFESEFNKYNEVKAEEKKELNPLERIRKIFKNKNMV